MVGVPGAVVPGTEAIPIMAATPAGVAGDIHTAAIRDGVAGTIPTMEVMDTDMVTVIRITGTVHPTRLHLPRHSHLKSSY